MQHCVGLVIVTNLPEIGRAAIMHRRGVYDTEKLQWETYPGDFQVTVFGCIDATTECFIDALGREVGEEIGPELQTIVESCRGDLKLLIESNNGRRKAMIYGLHLPDPSWLKKVRLHGATAGLYPFTLSLQSTRGNYFDGHREAALKALEIC